MERDLDLVRLILLEVEKYPYAKGEVDLKINKYTEEQISYHVMLLEEAGFLVAHDMSTLAEIDFRPARLTWAGHEFVDLVRDGPRWTAAKNTVKKIGGTAFPILIDILTGLVKSKLQELGISL